MAARCSRLERHAGKLARAVLRGRGASNGLLLPDRLVAITSTAGLVWSARYDGDGVRLGQVVNGQAITYTLDLAAPLVTVLAEAQPNKRITYLYGLGDSPLAEDDGATWTYLSGRDALNSARQETDAAGLVVAARSFDPYGVVLSGDGGGPLGYTGEFQDETGLVFMRARYLQVADGRFITRDTWPGDDLSPLSHNSWLYAAANPANRVDPSGLLSSSPIEAMIQVEYQDKYAGRYAGGIYPEYPIPGGSKSGLSLLFAEEDPFMPYLSGAPNGNDGRADLVGLFGSGVGGHL